MYAITIIGPNQKKGEKLMKNIMAHLYAIPQKINRQHIQMAFVIMTLVMLVLGAGAPDDGGGSIR